MKSTRCPHRLPQQTRIGHRTAQLLIKASVWFIHWLVRPVRGLHRLYLSSMKQHKSDRNSSSTQCYDGASRTHDNCLPFFIRNIFYKYRQGKSQPKNRHIGLVSFLSHTILAATAYIPCPVKNRTTLFLPLTLRNANRFSKFFHRQT